MDSESVGDHRKSKNEDGVHGPILEVHEFLNSIYIMHGELADNDCTDAIAEKNEGHRESKSESAHDTVDRESGINDFQINDLGDVGYAFSTG